MIPRQGVMRGRVKLAGSFRVVRLVAIAFVTAAAAAATLVLVLAPRPSAWVALTDRPKAPGARAACGFLVGPSLLGQPRLLAGR